MILNYKHILLDILEEWNYDDIICCLYDRAGLTIEQISELLKEMAMSNEYTSIDKIKQVLIDNEYDIEE